MWTFNRKSHRNRKFHTLVLGWLSLMTIYSLKNEQCLVVWMGLTAHPRGGNNGKHGPSLLMLRFLSRLRSSQSPLPPAADVATTLYWAILLSYDNCDRNRVTTHNLAIIETTRMHTHTRTNLACHYGNRVIILISAGSVSWEQFGASLGGCFISLIPTLWAFPKV